MAGSNSTQPRGPRRVRRSGGSAESLTEREVAERYGIPPKTLQSRRAGGRPPVYLKLDESPKAAIRYRVRDIELWLATCERRSTSDPGGPAAGEAR